MRFLAIYLAVGMFFTYMNSQMYEKICGKPIGLYRVVGGVYFTPILSPFVLIFGKSRTEPYLCD